MDWSLPGRSCRRFKVESKSGDGVSFADRVGAFEHLSLLLVSLWLFPPTLTSGTKKEPAGVRDVPIVTPVQMHRPTDSKIKSSKIVVKEPPRWGATAAIGSGLSHPLSIIYCRTLKFARAVMLFLTTFFNIFLNTLISRKPR